jgi:hypothetical protein
MISFVLIAHLVAVIYGQIPQKPNLISSWKSDAVTISTAVGGVDMNMTGTIIYNEAAGTNLNATTPFFGLAVRSNDERTLK